MTPGELCAWLMTHGHTNVEIVGPDRVHSTLDGKDRAYVRIAGDVNTASTEALFPDGDNTAYWKKVKR